MRFKRRTDEARGTWSGVPFAAVPGSHRPGLLPPSPPAQQQQAQKLRKAPGRRPPSSPALPRERRGRAERWLPWRRAVFVTPGVPRAGMASQQQSVPCISRSPPEQPLQVKVVGFSRAPAWDRQEAPLEVREELARIAPGLALPGGGGRGSEGLSRLGLDRSVQ